MVQLCREQYGPNQSLFDNYFIKNSESDLFFSKIRKDITTKVSERIIESGQSLQEKSTPLSREQIFQMSYPLCYRGFRLRKYTSSQSA